MRTSILPTVLPFRSLKRWTFPVGSGSRLNSTQVKTPKISNKQKWLSVVGLEIHAQIQSDSKLFSRSPNKFAASVNSLVSLFDCAIPGSLPVLNKRCVEAGILTGMALDCQINLVSEFDRKHYFYADMPAGYQITQQRFPLATNGHLEFVVYNPAVHKTAYRKKSVIKQLQLEQDSGKSLHDLIPNGSLIDLNRAGVGLMELVFEPDLENGEEAAALVNELTRILTLIQTCNCKMEEGSLRVDANVSVNQPGDSFGTRTEIKNLNSIRGVARAIDYEIKRQILILEKGGAVVNETRGYDSQSKQTVSMRDKEMKQDYRYMPEPNLPPLRLLDINLDPTDFRSKIPTLPREERDLIAEKYQLSLETTMQLVSEQNILTFFKNVMSSTPNLSVKLVSNFLLTDLLGLLNKGKKTIDHSPVSFEVFGQIVELMQSKTISHSTGKDLLEVIYQGDSRSPAKIIEEKGWKMVNDVKLVETICQQLIAANPKAVTAYRSGKTKALYQLVSQLKKTSNNQFNMALVVKTFERLINETPRET